MSKSRRCKSCNKWFSDQSNSLRIRRHGFCNLCHFDNKGAERVLEEYIDSKGSLAQAEILSGVKQCRRCNADINGYVSVGRVKVCSRCDTFNDDTPAETFGDIQWDMGTQDRTEEVVVIPCPKCQKAVPYDKHGALFLIGKQAVCSDCYVNNDGERFYAGKKYTTRIPNPWRRDEKKVEVSSKMRLIGIAGPARAGKDTLASYMLDNLDGIWSRSSFADPIKEMLRAIGVDCSDDAKAVVNDDYGVTPRHMMQTLGTEWGRHMIDGDIWVKAFARLNAGKCVIVPDVRFENEAALVREHGVLIHLVGRGGIEGNHVSENAIEFKLGDIVIDNSRDLAWLHAQVDGNAVLGEFVSAE